MGAKCLREERYSAGNASGAPENLECPILSLVLKGELEEHRGTEMGQYFVRCTESGKVCGVEGVMQGRVERERTDRVVSWTKM